MSEMIPEHLLDYVAGRFKVLGDSTRLAILRQLIQGGEMSVGELVTALSTSQANVSKHLRVLFDARMVGRRPQGTTVYYSVIDPSVTRLCDIVCDRLRVQAEAEAEILSAR